MILPCLGLRKNSCITNFCNILLRRLYGDCCRFQSNYSRRSWKAFRKCCQGTAPSKRKNIVLETFQIWLRIDKGRQIFKVLFTHFTDFIFNVVLYNYIFYLKRLSYLALIFLFGEKTTDNSLHAFLGTHLIKTGDFCFFFCVHATKFNCLSSDIIVLAVVVLCMQWSPISSSLAHPCHISHR